MKKQMVRHGVAKKKEEKETVVLGDTPFLPEEIITNILKRLPVKSLLRFQPACKYWRNLIKYPSFIADHLHHINNQTPSLLLHPDYRFNCSNLYVVDSKKQAHNVQQPPYMIDLCCASIIGSCNGLICVHYTGYTYDYLRTCLFLWNPSIREVKPVLDIIFDANNRFFYFGFGYVPIANDYKIVSILISDYEIKRVDLYSLNTDSWKVIEFGNIKDVHIFWDSASANGSIFWYVTKAADEDGIVSFDMENEVFTWMPVETPLDDFELALPLNVFVHDKKLVFFCIVWRRSSFEFWVLEEGVDASGCKQYWSWKKSSLYVSTVLSTIESNISTIWPSSGVNYISFYVESLVPIPGEIYKY